jgi:hypothetical protein
MDVADVLDEYARPFGIATRPDIVDENVGTLGQITWPTGKNWADVARRPTAFDDLIAISTQGIGLLTGQVEIVVNHENSRHLAPPP